MTKQQNDTATPDELLSEERVAELRKSIDEARQRILDNLPIEVKLKGSRTGVHTITAHPETTKLPVLTTEEFEALVHDVAENGFQTKVKLATAGADNAEVLLGRHRVAAAAVLGISVPTEMFTGTTDLQAKAEVVSSDLNRRHLTDAQRACYVVEELLPAIEAAAAERMKAGKTLSPTGGRGRAPRAAELASALIGHAVSARSIDRAKTVCDAPETRELVRSGEIRTVSKAQSAAKKELGVKPTKAPAKKGGKGKAPASKAAPTLSKRLADHIVAAEKIRAALGDLDRSPTEASLTKWLTQLDQHEVITTAIRTTIADLRRAKADA